MRTAKIKKKVETRNDVLNNSKNGNNVFNVLRTCRF